MPLPHPPFARIRAILAARRPRRLLDPRAAQASVALILCPAGTGLEALLIVRAKDPSDPWSGQVGLPGGHLEGRDRDRLAAALRETFEETGVRLSRRHLLGELDDLRPGWPGLPRIVIRPFVFGLRSRPKTFARAEVSMTLWAELAGLARSEGTATVRLRSGKARVPCYRSGRRVIWGITRRILVSFLRKVRLPREAPAAPRRGPSPPRSAPGARRA